MAARTIVDPKARIATILVAPLMSCSARLPVYVLLIGAFVEPAYGPGVAGLALFGMHFVGMLVAMPVAYLLNRFVLKTKPQPFLLELPPYRVPKARDVIWRMFEKGKAFVANAGTVIFAMTIIIWAMLYFPRPESVEEEVTASYVRETAQAGGIGEAEVRAALEEEGSELAARLENRVQSAYIEQSVMGRLGKAIQPVFAPAGFDWKITVGVLASFPAREVIIATLGIIYNLGGDADEESESLRESLAAERWSEGPLAGKPVYTLPVVFAVMVFFALCMQCGATLAVIAREANWKYAVFTFFYMTFLAWLGAVAVYQAGTAFWGT
jgi:ferrous iron transport protein B